MTDEQDATTTGQDEPQAAPDDVEPDPSHETAAEVGADEPTETSETEPE